MSVTTAPTNGSPMSAVDFVRSLSGDDKGHVLIALLRELIEANGGRGLIPIGTPEGESLGYYVPPKAAQARFELYGPKFTAEERAELDRRKSDPGRVLTAEEWITELTARAAEPERQTP